MENTSPFIDIKNVLPFDDIEDYTENSTNWRVIVYSIAEYSHGPVSYIHTFNSESEACQYIDNIKMNFASDRTVRYYDVKKKIKQLDRYIAVATIYDINNFDYFTKVKCFSDRCHLRSWVEVFLEDYIVEIDRDIYRIRPLYVCKIYDTRTNKNIDHDTLYKIFKPIKKK